MKMTTKLTNRNRECGFNISVVHVGNFDYRVALHHEKYYALNMSFRSLSMAAEYSASISRFPKSYFEKELGDLELGYDENKGDFFDGLATTLRIAAEWKYRDLFLQTLNSLGSDKDEFISYLESTTVVNQNILTYLKAITEVEK
ncbi:hypothetical protein [Vibrio owensii]|uniref:hypothetical protein n=1 Tax=Vibrio owensii TaxID=696485 RepID=UPI003CE44F69